MGHARALLGLDDLETIRKLAQRAIRERLSVRATEALVREPREEAREEGRKPPTTDSPALRARPAAAAAAGRAFRVIPKSAVAGKLEVEYTSLDELDGILAKIGA